MDAAGMVKMARRRAGLTQRELARRSGVAQPTVSRIEAGRMSPTFDTLNALVRASGMQLMTGDRGGRGVDETQLWERVRWAPAERFRQAVVASRNIRRMLASARPAT
jgi:transcriptional regulator with XRE-family HTH domain